MFNRIQEAKAALLGVIRDSQRNSEDIYNVIVVEGSASKTIARTFWNMIVSFEDYLKDDSDLSESFFAGRIQKVLKQLNEDKLISNQGESFQFIAICKPVIDELKEKFNACNDSSVSFESLEHFVASFDLLGSDSPVISQQIEVVQAKIEPHVMVAPVADVVPNQMPEIKVTLFPKDKNPGIIPAPVIAVMKRQENLFTTINKLNDEFILSDYLQAEKDNEKSIVDIDRIAKAYEMQNRNAMERLKTKASDADQELQILAPQIERGVQELRGLNYQKTNMENKKLQFNQLVENFNKLIKAFNNDHRKLFKELNTHVKVDKLYGFTGEAWIHSEWNEKTIKDLRQSLWNGIKQINENLRNLLTQIELKAVAQSKLTLRQKECQGLLIKLTAEMDQLTNHNIEEVKMFEDLKNVFTALKQNLLNLKKLHVIPSQVAEWKTTLTDYFDDRNEKYYWRDVTESVGVGFIGLFGSKKKTQYQKRKEYIENKVNPAIDQYATDGNEKALFAVLEEGNQFGSRVDETSIRFDTTLKGQIQEIRSELAKTSSSNLKQ